MNQAERTTRLQALEQVRNSRVLAYFLADRETFPPGVPGFTTQLHGEPQLLLIDLLRQIGHTPRLDLFLYTRGGATDAVWPLVTALRAHTDHLSVLVPWRAHSAGTLICLGADEIVMLDEAELSPIDPTTGNQFNPRDPTNPSVQYGVSVEDVAAYFELAKLTGGLTEEASRLEVFKALSASVQPLALGNVQRVYTQIRRVGARLLGMHMKGDEKKLDSIVKGFTTDFYSHLHAVSRDEAVELLGDWVRGPEPAERDAIQALFEGYASLFELRTRFNLPHKMGDQTLMPIQALGAVLETSAASFLFSTDMNVMQRSNFPPGVQVQVPPGQPLPLVPWASRSFDFAITSMGWQPNANGE